MEALTRLKQTSTVATYKAQFEGLSNRLKGLSEKHKLNCFLSDLKDEIRLPIRMLNPISLNIAFGLEKIQEEYVWSTRKALKGVVGAVEGNSQGEGVTRYNQRSNFQAKKVSSTKMDEKKKKGLCYHCEEKWNPSHVCKSPKTYLLQVEGEEGKLLMNFYSWRCGVFLEINSVLILCDSDLVFLISCSSSCIFLVCAKYPYQLVLDRVM